ncbi:PRC-barrel domain-containing protein [Jannaschia sp. S6380]|uniref:PRC-barrel domain-containing protein n=1 Tax=Jannaschia sp. S6380 TaxID=2926408 RepID=UPI001FF513F2|nr:PRC-barrel domain-containing protein [Jannaschia sp. S6380]MCK0168849.1 PRC-barrel domain-containing protein [Jannaschia sp. S6380]
MQELIGGGLVVAAFSALPVAAQDQPEGGYGAFADTAVSELVGQNVLSAVGDNVGEVEALVSADGAVLAVLGVGGFLGFGEHDVAVPLTELSPAEGALLLEGLDRETLEAMPEYGGEGEPLAMNTTVAGAPIAEEPALPDATVIETPTE